MDPPGERIRLLAKTVDSFRKGHAIHKHSQSTERARGDTTKIDELVRILNEGSIDQFLTAFRTARPKICSGRTIRKKWDKVVMSVDYSWLSKQVTTLPKEYPQQAQWRCFLKVVRRHYPLHEDMADLLAVETLAISALDKTKFSETFTRRVKHLCGGHDCKGTKEKIPCRELVTQAIEMWDGEGWDSEGEGCKGEQRDEAGVEEDLDDEGELQKQLMEDVERQNDREANATQKQNESTGDNDADRLIEEQLMQDMKSLEQQNESTGDGGGGEGDGEDEADGDDEADAADRLEQQNESTGDGKEGGYVSAMEDIQHQLRDEESDLESQSRVIYVNNSYASPSTSTSAETTDGTGLDIACQRTEGEEPERQEDLTADDGMAEVEQTNGTATVELASTRNADVPRPAVDQNSSNGALDNESSLGLPGSECKDAGPRYHLRRTLSRVSDVKLASSTSTGASTSNAYVPMENPAVPAVDQNSSNGALDNTSLGLPERLRPMVGPPPAQPKNPGKRKWPATRTKTTGSENVAQSPGPPGHRRIAAPRVKQRKKGGGDGDVFMEPGGLAMQVAGDDSGPEDPDSSQPNKRHQANWMDNPVEPSMFVPEDRFYLQQLGEHLTIATTLQTLLKSHGHDQRENEGEFYSLAVDCHRFLRTGQYDRLNLAIFEAIPRELFDTSVGGQLPQYTRVFCGVAYHLFRHKDITSLTVDQKLDVTRYERSGENFNDFIGSQVGRLLKAQCLSFEEVLAKWPTTRSRLTANIEGWYTQPLVGGDGLCEQAKGLTTEGESLRDKVDRLEETNSVLKTQREADARKFQEDREATKSILRNVLNFVNEFGKIQEGTSFQSIGDKGVDALINNAEGSHLELIKWLGSLLQEAGQSAKSLEDFRGKAEGLETQLAELQVQNEAAHDERKELRDKVQQLQGQSAKSLEDLQCRKKDLETQLAELQQLQDQAAKGFQDLQEKAGNLETERDAANEKFLKANEECKELGTEVQQLQKQSTTSLQELQVKITRLQEKAADLETERDAANGKVLEAQQLQEQSTASLQALQDKITGLQKAADTELNDLRTQLAEATTRYQDGAEELANAKAQADTTLKEYRDSVQQPVRRSDEFTASEIVKINQLAELSEKLKASETEKNDLAGQNLTLQSTVDKGNEKMKQLIEASDLLNAELTRLQEKKVLLDDDLVCLFPIDAGGEPIVPYEDVEKQLRRDLSSAENALATARGEIEVLMNDLKREQAASRDKLDGAKKKLQEADAEHQMQWKEAGAVSNKLGERLKAEQDLNATATADYEKLAAEVRELTEIRQEAQKLATQIIAAEGELQTVQEQFRGESAAKAKLESRSKELEVRVAELEVVQMREATAKKLLEKEKAHMAKGLDEHNKTNGELLDNVSTLKKDLEAAKDSLEKHKQDDDADLRNHLARDLGKAVKERQTAQRELAIIETNHQGLGATTVLVRSNSMPLLAGQEEAAAGILNTIAQQHGAGHAIKVDTVRGRFEAATETNQIATAQAKLQRVEEELKTVQEQFRHENTAKDELESRSKELEDRIVELEAVQEREATAKKLLEEKLLIAAGLEETNKTLFDDVSTLENYLGAAKDSLEQHGQDEAVLRNQLTQAQSDLETANKNTQTVQRELALIEANHQRMKEGLGATTALVRSNTMPSIFNITVQQHGAGHTRTVDTPRWRLDAKLRAAQTLHEQTKSKLGYSENERNKKRANAAVLSECQMKDEKLEASLSNTVVQLDVLLGGATASDCLTPGTRGDTIETVADALQRHVQTIDEIRRSFDRDLAAHSILEIILTLQSEAKDLRHRVKWLDPVPTDLGVETTQELLHGAMSPSSTLAGTESPKSSAESSKEQHFQQQTMDTACRDEAKQKPHCDIGQCKATVTTLENTVKRRDQRVNELENKLATFVTCLEQVHDKFTEANKWADDEDTSDTDEELLKLFENCSMDAIGQIFDLRSDEHPAWLSQALFAVISFAGAKETHTVDTYRRMLCAARLGMDDEDIRLPPADIEQGVKPQEIYALMGQTIMLVADDKAKASAVDMCLEQAHGKSAEANKWFVNYRGINDGDTLATGKEMLEELDHYSTDVMDQILKLCNDEHPVLNGALLAVFTSSQVKEARIVDLFQRMLSSARSGMPIESLSADIEGWDFSPRMLQNIKSVADDRAKASAADMCLKQVRGKCKEAKEWIYNYGDIKDGDASATGEEVLQQFHDYSADAMAEIVELCFHEYPELEELLLAVFKFAEMREMRTVDLFQRMLSSARSGMPMEGPFAGLGYWEIQDLEEWKIQYPMLQNIKSVADDRAKASAAAEAALVSGAAADHGDLRKELNTARDDEVEQELDCDFSQRKAVVETFEDGVEQRDQGVKELENKLAAVYMCLEEVHVQFTAASKGVLDYGDINDGDTLASGQKVLQQLDRYSMNVIKGILGHCSDDPELSRALSAVFSFFATRETQEMNVICRIPCSARFGMDIEDLKTLPADTEYAHDKAEASAAEEAALVPGAAADRRALKTGLKTSKDGRVRQKPKQLELSFPESDIITVDGVKWGICSVTLARSKHRCNIMIVRKACERKPGREIELSFKTEDVMDIVRSLDATAAKEVAKQIYDFCKKHGPNTSRLPPGVRFETARPRGTYTSKFDAFFFDVMRPHPLPVFQLCNMGAHVRTELGSQIVSEFEKKRQRKKKRERESPAVTAHSESKPKPWKTLAPSQGVDRVTAESGDGVQRKPRKVRFADVTTA